MLVPSVPLFVSYHSKSILWFGNFASQLSKEEETLFDACQLLQKLVYPWNQVLFVYEKVPDFMGKPIFATADRHHTYYVSPSLSQVLGW